MIFHVTEPVTPFAVSPIPWTDFTSVGLTAETYTAGARFSYRRWERFTPFAQVLLGGIHAAAVAGSFTGATNEFGGGAGGGVDIALDSRGRFALRPQLEYFAGRPNQNKPSTVRFSVSVVYRMVEGSSGAADRGFLTRGQKSLHADAVFSFGASDVDIKPKNAVHRRLGPEGFVAAAF